VVDSKYKREKFTKARMDKSMKKVHMHTGMILNIVLCSAWDVNKDFFENLKLMTVTL